MQGTLRLPVALPREVNPTRIHFAAPGVMRVVTLLPGQALTLRFAASSRRPWTLRFKVLSGAGYLSDGRPASARAPANPASSAPSRGQTPAAARRAVADARNACSLDDLRAREDMSGV